MTYAAKVFYWLLFFFLFLYLGVSIVTLRVISQHAMNQEHERALANQKNTAILFAAKLDNQTPDAETLQHLSGTLKNIIKNDFEIVDQYGHRIYASNSTFPKTTDIVSYHSIKENTVTISPIISLEDKKYLFATSMIGTSDYYLISKQSLESYESLLKRVRYYFRMILIMLQLILLPMSWFLTNLITKPIQKLIDRASDIAKGHTEEQFIIEKRGDEVETLAHSLNKMAKKLNQDIEAIRIEKEKQELFVSSLSHEIRTPLTSIIGYAQMLQWEQLDETAAEYIDYILEESFRLKNLSDDVLRLIQSEKNEMKIAGIDTAQIETYLRHFMSGQNEAVTMDLHLQQTVIMLDVNLFKLVVANILSNALASMNGQGEIAIEGRAEEQRYFLTFHDNGHGISKEHIDKVTDVFYTDDSTRSSGHLGLGLSLVKNIVSLHDGEVKIESKKNVGTSITIDFSVERRGYE